MALDFPPLPLLRFIVGLASVHFYGSGDNYSRLLDRGDLQDDKNPEAVNVRQAYIILMVYMCVRVCVQDV